MKKAFFLCAVVFIIFHNATAQTIEIETLPQNQIVTAGSDAKFDVKFKVSDFSASLYLRAKTLVKIIKNSPVPPDTLHFQTSFMPSAINSPYTQSCVFTVKTQVQDTGVWKLIVLAENGSIVASDTISLQIQSGWGGDWQRYPRPADYDAYIYGYIGRAGDNFLFSTYSDKIYSFEPKSKKWSKFDAWKKGIETTSINNAWADTEGKIWCAVYQNNVNFSGGLYKYDGKYWSSFTYENSNIPHLNLARLCVDKNENVWFVSTPKQDIIGVYGNIGYRKPNGEIFVFDTTQVPGRDIFAVYNNAPTLFTDTSNNIWVNNYINNKGRGIIRWNGSEWQDMTPELSKQDSFTLIKCFMDDQAQIWAHYVYKNRLDEAISNIYLKYESNQWVSNKLPAIRFIESMFSTPNRFFYDSFNTIWTSENGNLIRLMDRHVYFYNYTSFPGYPGIIIIPEIINIDKDENLLWLVAGGPISVNLNSLSPGLILSAENNLENIIDLINYPNPASISTKISFTQKENSPVLLKIFDILGNKIFEQNLGWLEAGPQEENISTENIPSGNYYLRIESGSQSETRKISVVH